MFFFSVIVDYKFFVFVKLVKTFTEIDVRGRRTSLLVFFIDGFQLRFELSYSSLGLSSEVLFNLSEFKISFFGFNYQLFPVFFQIVSFFSDLRRHCLTLHFKGSEFFCDVKDFELHGHRVIENLSDLVKNFL